MPDNPGLVRLLAEESFRSSPDITKPDLWENISGTRYKGRHRPPYEQFDNAPGGGKIYVQFLDAPLGWHEEFNRPIRFQAV